MANVKNKLESRYYMGRVGSSLFLAMLLSTLLQACLSDQTVDMGQKVLPAPCSQGLAALPVKSDDPFSWEESRDISLEERHAIENLTFITEIDYAQTNQGYRNYQQPGSKIMQERLLSGEYRTLLPIQNRDGWNLFVVGKLFAPDSNFIQNFVLLIEGRNGWQSRQLFPSEKKKNGSNGGYSLSLYDSDLNHDGRKELLFVSASGGSGAIIETELLQVMQPEENPQLNFHSIEVPRLHSYRTQFQDNYAVIVQLEEEKSPTLIRRVPAAQKNDLGYDNRGKWVGGKVKPWLSESPVRAQPVEWRCNNTLYSLLYTVQPLKGLFNADNIGFFGTFWMLQTEGASTPVSQNSAPAPKDSQELADVPNTENESEQSDLSWGLVENNFTPALGNEVVDYEQLLP